MRPLRVAIGVTLGNYSEVRHTFLQSLPIFVVVFVKKALDRDLSENWAVTAEAVQTILRREKFDRPYEALKAATRGENRRQRKEKQIVFLFSCWGKVNRSLCFTQ